MPTYAGAGSGQKKRKQGRPPGPSEISSGLAPPKKRRPPQAPSPEDIHPSFSAPNAPLPSGPPIPVLQKYNFHGSIHDVNDRVERIADAYKTKFGMLPSWGLTFDLLRAPVDDFHSLLAAVPHSGAVAKAKSALGGPAAPLSSTGEPKPHQQAFVEDLTQASRDGRLADFEAQNRDELKGILTDKHWASKVLAALDLAQQEQLGYIPESLLVGEEQRRAKPKLLREYARLSAERQRAQERVMLGQGSQEHVTKVERKLVKIEGFVPELGAPTSGAMGTLATAVGQITSSLAYSPAGIYHLGRAGGHDWLRMIRGKAPTQTPVIAKETVKSIARDIRHPEENPGYLFMDVLGLASGGLGTGLRVTRAGALLREGEIGGATRALLTRPVGGTYELRKGGHSEHVLLFENPLAQVVQRGALKLRQRALNRREIEPHGRQPLTSAKAIDLSSEAKMAREAEARKRVESAIARTYTSELEKAAGWSLVSAQVFSRLPVAIRRAGEKLPGHAPHGLTRGEQKAIQVFSTDDENPLALHRDFHERMKLTPTLGEQFGLSAEQFIANHDRHLADLKLAETVLGDLAAGKARKRFQTAVDETQRVVAEQQRLKIDELGLLPDTAEKRIIGPADVMRRGEAIPDLAAIRGKLDKLETEMRSRIKQGETQVTIPIERPRTRAEAEARLTEIEKANEKVLSGLTGKYRTIDRAEQNRRSRINSLIDYFERTGKTDKPGMKKALRAGRQSVLSEAMDVEAEAALQAAIEKYGDHPVVRAYVARLDEANQLRELLNAPEDPFGKGPRAEPDYGTVNEGRVVVGQGADVGRLSARADVLQGRLAAGDERRAGLERATPESFYLPFVPKRHKRTLPRELIRRARFGPYGVPMARDLPELKHVFTGKSIIAGDFRIDSTALAGEAYGKTVRLVSIRHDHARLMKMARDTQAEAGPFAVPIRDIADIPPALKDRLAKIDEGEFTSADAEKLGANASDAILRELYPNPAEPLENVKWVDGRLIADEGIRVQEGRITGRTAQGTPLSGLMDIVNEPFRLSYLFLRPAYALNLVGNTGMALLHQGIYTPINLGRALMAEKLYGGDVARGLDVLAGEGKMQAIAETAGTGKLTAASRTIGHAWSILTDRHFRRAALIHELRRMGYREPEQIRAALFDRANLNHLTQAKRRANKAMVEFDNLTHYEKTVLRHFIFVYPWVSRSAVWSIRTLIEHPVQSEALVQLGHQAQEDEDPLFTHTPDWVKRVGYIPVGYNADGNPKIINPTSVNTFSTLNDFIQLAQGGEIPEDFSAPGIEIGIRAFTQADQYGQRYTGGERVYGPFRESVQQIPLARGFTGPKAQPKVKPLDVSDKRAFVKREHEALKASVLGGGWLGNWGSVIAGGMSPRELNLDAAAARYWRDQPPEARNKHERALIQQGLSLQGEMLLKAPVPKELRQAVDIAGEETLARTKRGQELGRDVPASSKEGALVDIGVLQKRGRLTSVEAQDLTERLKKLPDTQAVTRFIRKLHSEHGGANLLRDWQADVNLVASFTPQTVKARLDDLRGQKLTDSAPPQKPKQEALYELGRQVLAFQHALSARKDAHDKDPRAEKSIALAELRAFQDEQDKPIVVDGHRFPSAVRLSWALLTPQEQDDHRVSVTTADWKSLSAFDKELLGRKSSADVTRGWANLQRLVSAFRGQVAMPGVPSLPPGQRLARNQLVYLAKYIEKGEGGYLKPSPGFFKDWLFSQEPKYRRLEMLAPIQKSKFQPQWKHLFADAHVLGKELHRGNYSDSALREAWHGYVNGDEFVTWLHKQPVGFRRELDRYGPDFLAGLLN